MTLACLCIAATSLLGVSAPTNIGPLPPNGYIPVTAIPPVSVPGSTEIYLKASISSDYGTAVLVTNDATQAYIAPPITTIPAPFPPATAIPVPSMSQSRLREVQWKITGLTPGYKYRVHLSGLGYYDGESEPWGATWEWVQ
jgi:hypothetical protein